LRLSCPQQFTTKVKRVADGRAAAQGGEDDLLERIYEAALTPDGWPQAMRAVAGPLGASSAFLFSTHCEVEPDAVLQVHNQSREMLDEFTRYWHTQDEWAMAARRKGRMTAGTVVTGQELVPRATLQKTAFYREFASRHGIGDLVGAVVFDGSEADGMPFTNLCWYRPPGAEPFDAAARQRVAQLLPHVQRSLRLQRRLHALADRRLNQALGGARIARVLLDGGATVRDCNEAGEELLLRLSSGRRQRLRSLGRNCHPPLADAIAASRGGVPVQVVGRIEGPPAVVISATVMRLPPERETLLGLQSDERFLLVAKLPHAHGAQTAAAVAPLFGFSAAETRVLGGLIDGKDAAEIAIDAGTTFGTVRTQIRNLLSKAGVNSQSELLRMLRTVL
jgi:DNA-binding CsgD family transcriptional regulator